jgi:hypothetical protein
LRIRSIAGVLAVTALTVAVPLAAQDAPASGAAQPPGARPPAGRGAQPSGAGRPARPAPPPSKPTPRWPDGRVNLGALPGQAGIWAGDGRLVINPKSYEPNSTRNALIHIDNVPLQDWARALTNARHAEFLRYEPHARCKPSGGPREFVTPYGFEIADFPDAQRVYVFDIGGPHSFRTIYMDGRPHPKNLTPSYYGHSIGRWDGDTLVIDAVGFNEKFWMSRDGLPHTDQLHLTERFTRTDFNTLKYEVTVDDPGAYTAPWTSGFNLRWSDGTELFEYLCQGNNFFPDEVFSTPDAKPAQLPAIAP